MSKKYCIFITTLFCAFIGLLLVATAIAPDRKFSPVENRYLQQLPVPSIKTLLTGSFMKQFETYATDQFVFRDHWTSAKAQSERFLGKHENNGAYFCKKDTLIARFDVPDPEKVSKNLSYVAQFAQKLEIPVYFSLLPGAVSVWEDRLPTGAPNANQQVILDQAASVASRAQWYDSGSILRAHKDEDIFYRTDHHWTSLGAYYGYTALMESMGITPIPLADYEKKTVSTNFFGTVYSSSGVRWVRPDQIDTYVPPDAITVTSYTYDKSGKPMEEARALYVERFLQEKDKYSMFLGGNQSLCVVRTPHTQAPKLVIVRDSYTDSLLPFLTPHFSEIHLIDLRYYKLSVADYSREHNIDAALVLYSVANFTAETNLVWLGT